MIIDTELLDRVSEQAKESPRLRMNYNFHQSLAYGDSIVVRNNQFVTLSTRFSEPTDAGMDSEMLYIKGSWNVIENNYFENGAGSSSDAVITLKVGQTEGNVIKNNEVLMSNTNGKFVYVSGRDICIEGNKFVSTYKEPTLRDAYCIYFGHHSENNESAIIRDNTFSFSGKSNYMVIYANSWGNLTVESNTFINPTKLLKCNKRSGNVYLRNNIVEMAHVLGGADDVFISLSYGEYFAAEIADNEFKINSSETGVFISGNSYVFSNNRVKLEKSTLHSLLRGCTQIDVVNNRLFIDDNTKMQREGLVGEMESTVVRAVGNSFEGRSIKVTFP